MGVFGAAGLINLFNWDEQKVAEHLIDRQLE